MIDSNFFMQKREAMVGSPSYRVNALSGNNAGFKDFEECLPSMFIMQCMINLKHRASLEQ